jgi:hypothetical protein
MDQVADRTSCAYCQQRPSAIERLTEAYAVQSIQGSIQSINLCLCKISALFPNFFPFLLSTIAAAFFWVLLLLLTVDPPMPVATRAVVTAAAIAVKDGLIVETDPAAGSSSLPRMTLWHRHCWRLRSSCRRTWASTVHF